MSALGWPLAAGSRAQVPPAPIYPSSDARADIDAAIGAAGKDGKYVLLDFGADWCPDCRVLAALFDTPQVAEIARANFHIVHIDVGRRDKNGDVAAQFRATSGDWIPAVVVIDTKGTVIARTDDRVRLTRRTTAGELATILMDWAPKARERNLASFTEAGVQVSVGLDRDRRGGLWLSATYTPMAAGVDLLRQE
jgi:thiol-disulfide isomerase/thioredoxin